MKTISSRYRSDRRRFTWISGGRAFRTTDNDEWCLEKGCKTKLFDRHYCFELHQNDCFNGFDRHYCIYVEITFHFLKTGNDYSTFSITFHLHIIECVDFF